jgi:hypothetical protein
MVWREEEGEGRLLIEMGSFCYPKRAKSHTDNKSG